VVVDLVTGLMWQADDQLERGVLYTWSEAKAHCANLKLNNCPGWRVPSRIELVSLVDFTRSQPAADVAFSQTPITAPYYFGSPDG
jgi:Protein of unknown function (DUF1566)